MNDLFKKLDYFKIELYASRIGNAVRLIKLKKPSHEVSTSYFYSPEGVYTDIALKSGVSLKIVGCGYDDYDVEPVVRVNDYLVRSPSKSLYPCVVAEQNTPRIVSESSKAPMKVST